MELSNEFLSLLLGMAWEREGVDEEWKAQWEARQRAARATYVVDAVYERASEQRSPALSAGRCSSVARSRHALTAAVIGVVYGTHKSNHRHIVYWTTPSNIR